MKPQPHRNTGAHHDAGRSPIGTRPIRQGEVLATKRHSPPVVPHRRYPSLSDDGQLYFPRWQQRSRPLEESDTVSRASGENDLPAFISVRVIALLAIVLLIAALIAGA